MSLYKKTTLFILIALFQFFLSRLLLFSMYSSHFTNLGFWTVFKAFFVGMRFDIASIIISFSIPLLLLNIPINIFRHKIWQGIWSWLLFAILAIMAALLLGDIVYYDYVKRHITYELFMMGGDDANEMSGMIFGIFLPYVIGYLIYIVLLFFIWKKTAAIVLKKMRFRWSQFALYFIFFLILIVLGRGGVGYKPVSIIDAFAAGKTNYGNLILNGVFSVSQSSLKAENINHHFFEKEKVYEILDLKNESSNPDFPLQKQNPLKDQKGYNLVFVLIESLSFKYVDSFAGLNYGITPNLDKFANEGLKFINFYAAGQRSVEGIQATLTGIPSIIGMPSIGVGLLSNYSKLGEMADKNGYTTLFVQSLKRRSFRIDAIAGSVGFKEFYGKEDMPILLDYPDPKAAKWGWDYETYMFAAGKIEKSSKPHLTYIVTSTTHTPYPPLPKKFLKYPHSEDKEEGFLNTIYYTDWSIGQFVNRLRNSPEFDKTIFIFTADHALAHYQSGGFKSRFQIPLIVYAPKIFKPSVIETVKSQVDLFPTIIQLLNLKGKYSSFGTSLFKGGDESFAFVREGSIMGIVTKEGFLRHSLKNRLETGHFIQKPDANNFDTMEKKLLAADQLTYELLQSNHWVE